MGNLSRIVPARKSGGEALTSGGQPLSFSLAGFWAWSRSDLLDNTERGVLAEFIVAAAVGGDLGGVRDGSAAWDITTPDGGRIEVKSAAYLQTWGQKRLSRISFGMPVTRVWDSGKGEFTGPARRHADVYVFALLAHTDKATVNPLDLDQWRFYVVPTATLNDRLPAQRTITLPALKVLTSAVTFDQLRAAVAAAAGRHETR